MNSLFGDFIEKSLLKTRNYIDEFIYNKTNIRNLELAINTLIESITNGNKIFACGNGGSMCDAMHFAQELTGRYIKDRSPLPAIAISDPSYLTCTVNDYGYDYAFERMIRGLGKKGDVLLAISTSGNSANVVKAVQTAKSLGISSIGLLGRDGGKVRDLCDISVIAPGENSARIQEIHIKCIHIMIEAIENKLFK